MDWMDFIASLVSSLAWPVAIALGVFWLRTPLRRALDGLRLRKLGVGPVAAEFGEAVHEAEEAAEELPTPEPSVDDQALSTELAPVISTAPRAAVIEAWVAVQRELEALAEQAGIARPPATRRWAPKLLVNQLRGPGVIDDALVSVLLELQEARNVAAHGGPATVERIDVVDYVKLAGRVRTELRMRRQAMAGNTSYDLLVYHDLSDSTDTTGGAAPSVGDRAEEWFGETIGGDRHVVAVGQGIHDGRVTVVLAHRSDGMPEVQAFLDRAAEHQK
jgi:hypothetical protein